jgi:RNA polymerase sigma factor (sigma-70 family)
MEGLNDPDFIRRLKHGHETAYRELNNQLFPYFRNFLIKKYEIDLEDAKDIVQDVAKRIVEKISQFDPDKGEFIPWAFQILRNMAIDWLRSNKKLEFISLEEAIYEATENDLETEQKADDLSPIERLPLEVRKAYLNLNDRYQQFLGLLLLEKSEEDVMKILNLDNKGALYTLKSRVFAKLKSEVEKIIDGEK